VRGGRAGGVCAMARSLQQLQGHGPGGPGPGGGSAACFRACQVKKCTDHSIASRRQQAHTRKRVPTALPHTCGRD
jgi:hypothetical protein